MNPITSSFPIEQLETKQVFKKITAARAALAELKGVSKTIPNEQILIETLSLQEAKDSSGIENIITTHDELYKNNENSLHYTSSAAKEVLHYAKALKFAHREIIEKEIISIRLLVKYQQIIEGNTAGIRKQAGTKLINENTNEVVYVPPQSHTEIMDLLSNLERLINNEIELDTDPLIKMGIIHHQFESIHPFYDGNGRTGRILNILYLIKEGLLDLPILYLSRYIIKNRQSYYALLQQTRDTHKWEAWTLYMLSAVEETALETIRLIKEMKSLMLRYKQTIRTHEKNIYSQDLLNNLFRHPYTKIKWLEQDLKVSRQTAATYLNKLSALGILKKTKMGNSNFYINTALFDLLNLG